MRSMWSRRFVIGVVPIALMIGAASVAAAQGGTLTGTVTAQAGGTPLQEARVHRHRHELVRDDGARRQIHRFAACPRAPPKSE